MTSEYESCQRSSLLEKFQGLVVSNFRKRYSQVGIELLKNLENNQEKNLRGSPF